MAKPKFTTLQSRELIANGLKDGPFQCWYEAYGQLAEHFRAFENEVFSEHIADEALLEILVQLTATSQRAAQDLELIK